MAEVTCAGCSEIIGEGVDEDNAIEDALDGFAAYDDIGDLICAECWETDKMLRN